MITSALFVPALKVSVTGAVSHDLDICCQEATHIYFTSLSTISVSKEQLILQQDRHTNKTLKKKSCVVGGALNVAALREKQQWPQVDPPDIEFHTRITRRQTHLLTNRY